MSCQDDCIRCGDAAAIDDEGLCGHCHWELRLEVEHGLFELDVYLSKHARFSDWLAVHGRAA